MDSVKNKKELCALIKSQQHKIFDYGVTKVAIFGSFARDEANDKSDEDFFMEFKAEAKTLKNFIGLKNYLQNLLGRNIEIVTPESLNKFIVSIF